MTGRDVIILRGVSFRGVSFWEEAKKDDPGPLLPPLLLAVMLL